MVILQTRCHELDALGSCIGIMREFRMSVVVSCLLACKTLHVFTGIRNRQVV